MLLIVESYAPLVERFPVAGAEFAHAYYAAGRYHAYLCVCGWFLTLGYLSIIPLNATAPELFARGRIHSEHGTPHVAIAFACAVSLVAPWFGRQALLWVVDMSALGTAFGYAYTCFAAYILLKSRGKGTSVALAGTLASLGFVVLLTVPGMPAFMSRPSWIALAGWVALGSLFFAVRARDYRSFSKQELDRLILKE